MDSAHLPEEIIEKIVKEHSVSLTFRELVAFSGVCRSWRSIAKDLLFTSSFPGILVSNTTAPREALVKHDPCRPHHQFRPVSTLFNSLLTPTPPRVLLSLQDCSTRRMMHLRNIEEHQEEFDLEKCHCVASKDGWLVLVRLKSDEDQPSVFPVRIFLLNPITGASIPLPPLLQHTSWTPVYDLTVLTCSPEKRDDCHLIVLSNSSDTRQLAWCKVNGGCWKFSSNKPELFNDLSYACYIGGKLYAVEWNMSAGSVLVFDNLINGTEDDDDEVVVVPPPTVVSIPFSTIRDSMCAMELNSQLILVLVPEYLADHDAVKFEVYKLERDNINLSNHWKQLKSLDGHAMFLRIHQSFCFPVKYDRMIKAEHIYYLNNSCGQCSMETNFDDSPLSLEFGIFNFENQQLVQHSRLGSHHIQDYVWFLPMPWDIHKSFDKKKMKQQLRKLEERHETDDNGFKQCSSSKVTDHTRRL
ncbi:hypothetical protein LINGRAHAP2_LOCUS13418 [Linum grandiflorum]